MCWKSRLRKKWGDEESLNDDARWVTKAGAKSKSLTSVREHASHKVAPPPASSSYKFTGHHLHCHLHTANRNCFQCCSQFPVFGADSFLWGECWYDSAEASKHELSASHFQQMRDVTGQSCDLLIKSVQGLTHTGESYFCTRVTKSRRFLAISSYHVCWHGVEQGHRATNYDGDEGALKCQIQTDDNASRDWKWCFSQSFLSMTCGQTRHAHINLYFQVREKWVDIHQSFEHINICIFWISTTISDNISISRHHTIIFLIFINDHNFSKWRTRVKRQDNVAQIEKLTPHAFLILSDTKT